jgi:hypothetical protein
MRELNKARDRGGFICFARGHAKEANEFNPDISCSARNADRPERRLAAGFLAAMPVEAD